MNQEKFKKINKACFLDRDGVLNEDIGYLHKSEDFKWIDGAVEAIKLLKKNNFLVIVITNQSGISRGYFTAKDVTNLHEWMNKILKKEILCKPLIELPTFARLCYKNICAIIL